MIPDFSPPRLRETTMTQRLDVEFLSGGITCRAWLYLPAADTPRPVIVMAHGLGARR